MANGMYGAPAGAIAASDQNMRENAMNLNLAMGNVALQKARIDLSAQEKMMQMLSQGFGGAGAAAAQPGSAASTDRTASMMDTLAGYAAASGLPQEAKQYADTASTLRRNQAYVTTQALNRTMKESSLYANLLDGVTDQQSWMKANALFTLQTGKQLPFARLPYNPKLVQMLKEGAISAKDKATIAAARAREDVSREQIKMDQERIALMKTQKNLAEQRRQVLIKTGGGKPPTAAYVKDITDLMVRDFGKQVPMETMRTLAGPVAERMQELIRTSPGLKPAEAAERAYQEAKAEGDFGGLRKMPSQMGTKENPIKLPQDKAKWQPNMYYTLPNGQIAWFDGKNFVAEDQTGGL